MGCVSLRVKSNRLASFPIVSARIESNRVVARTRLSLRMTSPLRRRITFRFVSGRLASNRVQSDRFNARTLLQLRTARPLAAGLRFVSYRCVSNQFKSVRFDSLQVVTRTLSPLRVAGLAPQGYVSFRVGSYRVESIHFESHRNQNPPAIANRQSFRRRVAFRFGSPRIGSDRIGLRQVASAQIGSDRFVSNQFDSQSLLFRPNTLLDAKAAIRAALAWPISTDASQLAAFVQHPLENVLWNLIVENVNRQVAAPLRHHRECPIDT